MNIPYGMEKPVLNRPTLAASVTMALTFLVHVFVGGPELYTPLRASGLPAIGTSTFSVIWHFTSVHLLLLATALGYLARHKNAALWLFVFASMTSFGVLFIGYGIADFRSLWVLPQWNAFIVAAACMVRAARPA